MSSRDFTDQIRGILQSAKDGATPTSHQAWVKGVLQLLQAAQRGEQIAVPEVEDYEASQVESSRLLFLACGFEEVDGALRPGEGEEVQVATAVVSEYLECLAQAETVQGRREAVQVEEPFSSDVLAAEVLSKTLEEEELRKAQPRPGERLSERKLCELGAAFERQPFGSDTCAIHSLNNLLQPKRSPEEAAAKSEEVRQAIHKDEQHDEKESWASTAGLVGPISMATLRAAEVESRDEEKASCGFVPPRQLSLLRADSGLSWPEEQRTGMFDVEAIKLAARSKGFEVIDVEPKPTWQDSEVSAFADAATQVKEVSQESRAHDKEHQKEKEEESPKQEKVQRQQRWWFRGFLVYERIPGRAMHYYSIVRWPNNTWMILDSLDRGDESPRNRLLTLHDVAKLYDQNGEFFRSWLLRWYPVVDRTAAIEDLQDAIRHEEAHTGPVLPPSQARAASQLDLSRWNAQQATRALLAAPRQVARELQVLQLTVSEQEARASLEATEWNFVSAVGHQSDKLLQHAKADCVESEARLTSASAFSALSATDWDVRRSAELLLLKERAEAEHISVDLSSAAAALRETNSVNEALLVVQLIHELHKENKDVDEAFAAKLLQHGDSCATARQIALVRSEFPSAPLAICAEALRRGEGQAAACILLKDFEDKVCSLVTALAHRVVSSRG
ncbi:unnamed protein product, partial [Durusdinium trenchii]